VNPATPEHGPIEDNGGLRPPASAETPADSKPLIYVASLADYNAGRLHGAWIDPATEWDELNQAVTDMLRQSAEPNAKEYAIHDFAGFGRHVELGEYMPLEQVHVLASGINEHGMSFAAWWAYTSPALSDRDELMRRYQSDYLGTWQSVDDFAEHRLEDLGADDIADRVPTWLQPYLALDVPAFARDLLLGGDIVAVEDVDGVHIFEGNAG
jgi:antirestriction protein